MTRVRLPPYPSVSDELRDGITSSLRFTCPGGPSPGERQTGPQKYTFGSGTDWSIEQHPLSIECRLTSPEVLAGLFGKDGLVCQNAKLMVALEWVSTRSSRRGFSKPRLIDFKEASSAEELVFVLEFPARDLAGNIQLSLELLVGAAGKPTKDERHLANSPGLRLGAISEPWQLVFDGSGSLFPIVHVSLAPVDPLWSFSADWDDPTFDEFSSDFVSLEINTSHPDFAELYGDAQAPYSTPLFRQVLASWLMLFFDELQNGAESEMIAPGVDVTQWRAVLDGKHLENILPGSVAKAAREFHLRGELDFTSKALLHYSVQRWIDARFSASE